MVIDLPFLIIPSYLPMLTYLNIPSFLDDVVVTGILSAKWSSDMKDVRCDLDPIFLANHMRYNIL